MVNCTESPFICVSQFHIIGIQIDGEGWFVVMLILAFILTFAANFIWLKNSQISREILQYKIGAPGRRPLICKSVVWTALSTIVWIFRVIFIIGNNLWIYIVILLGNVIGTATAAHYQIKDEENTFKILINEISNDTKKQNTLKKILGLSLQRRESKIDTIRNF